MQKGPLETAAAFPVLCASCGGSTTHVLRPPPEARDTKRSSSPAKARGVSFVSANTLGLRSVSLTRREDSWQWTSGCRWDTLSQKLCDSLGSQCKRGALPSKDPCQRWDNVPSAGISCPEEAYNCNVGAQGYGMSICLKVCILPSSTYFPLPHCCFHIWIQGFFAHTISPPLTKPVLKSHLTISQMPLPLSEQRCTTWER